MKRAQLVFKEDGLCAKNIDGDNKAIIINYNKIVFETHNFIHNALDIINTYLIKHHSNYICNFL